MHPKTIIKTDDVSKKWRSLSSMKKLLEIHFEQRKWAKWGNSWCSYKKKSNENARDSVFFLGVKSGLSTVSLFCVRIKHFEFRDINTN